MKFFAIIAVCIAGAVAAPQGYSTYGNDEIRITSYDAPAVKFVAPTNSEVKAAPAYGYDTPAVVKKVIPIVRFDLTDDNAGIFNLETVSGDGSTQSQSGSLRNLGDAEGSVQVMKGAYSFVSDDGKTYSVSWTSDENGFVASGDHLPTPVPMPEELRKAFAEAKVSSSFDSFEAPAIRNSYQAPAIRNSYEAPAIRNSYEAPAIRNSYEAPAIRKSYEAPAIRNSYEAPAIRNSYEAPAIRNSYEAPAIRSSYDAESRVQTYEAPSFKVVSTC